MSVKHFAGFAAICGLAIVGLDFYQLSKASETGLSVQDYFSDLPSRLSGGEAVSETREYLPDAPEGWVRRALADGNNAPLWLDAGGDAAEQAASRGWIYAKDDTILWVEAVHSSMPSSKGITSGMAEISASQIAYQPEYQGYAVIGGVGFAEMLIPSWQDPLGFRIFDGWIGFDDEVRIQVRASGSDAAIHEVLAAIDYESLNGLLQTPVPSIAREARIAPEHASQVAAEMVALRKAMIDFRAQAAAERSLNSSAAAQLLNTFVEPIVPGLSIDATGGTQPDYDALIQTTYRAALDQILADRGVSAPAGNSGKLVCTSVGQSTRCRSGG